MDIESLALYRQGKTLLEQGKIAEASAQWSVLNERAGPLAPAWLRPWLSFHAAQSLPDAKNWEQSNRLFAQAAQQCRPAGPEVCRQILVEWSTQENHNGDWTGARQHAFDSVAEAREAQAQLGLAEALDFIGLWEMNRGEVGKAAEYLGEARKLREKFSPGSLELSRTLQYLAWNFINQDNLSAAEDLAHRAVAIEEKLAPGGTDILVALTQLRIVATRRDDLAHAEEYTRRMVEIAERALPDTRHLADAYYTLARVLYRRGDLQAAEKYGQQSLALNERLAPVSIDIPNSLTVLGWVAIKRGAWDQAESYLRRAMAIAEKASPGSPFHIDHTMALAEMFQKKGDWPRAEEYFLRARELARMMDPEGGYVAGIDDYLGQVAWSSGRVAEAEKYFSDALSLYSHLGTSISDQAEMLASLGKIKLRNHDLQGAEELYAQALSHFESAYERLGGSTEARTGFRAGVAGYYADYVDLLMRRGQQEKAFEILERGRTRALLDMLASAHVDLRKGADQALLDRERRLQARIAAESEQRAKLVSSGQESGQLKLVEKEIAGLVGDLEEVEGEIRSTSPAFAALARPSPLLAAEVQHDLLASDTLLLEYSLGEQRSYVFIVSQDSIQAAELPRKAEIEKAARRVYELLAARNRQAPGETVAQRQQRLDREEKNFPAAAAALSRMVLAPVADKIHGKRLLIVADGALNYVPFAALPEPSADMSTAAAAQPLVLGHEIVSLPSASVLSALRRQARGRKPATRMVAVLADPVFEKADPRVNAGPAGRAAQDSRGHGGERGKSSSDDSLSAQLLTRSAADLGINRGGRLALPRLRFTRLEADAILAVTKSRGMEALDFQASRATVFRPELSEYRVVHFATHGLLNNEHPELSGLVFSLVKRNGQPQDGFLQLQDIYNLNLPVDLVVLSACQTGMGKEISGEGLISLTRGFMYAGASRVVASLWNVSDVATARLMSDFYRAMGSGGMSPAAALRAAQIKMWKQKRWNSPYYWAAFQLQGEWK